MAAIVLMTASAGILLALGLIHLLYTFWGPNLTPRDPALQLAMAQVSPVLTSQTTMWRCWIGFNASHSMGAILFGLIYGYLALTQAPLLFGSPFLLIIGLAMTGGFFLLGWAYWFSIPFKGISVALACYVGSVALSRI